jgi:hypothetical protein
MIKPWLTLVVWISTVELASRFGMILRVIVQDLGINMWKTVGSTCLQNTGVKRIGFTETIM